MMSLKNCLLKQTSYGGDNWRHKALVWSILTKMNIQGSRSEDAGIALLAGEDLAIYSVGISTGGVAEIRMAELNPGRHIIATTIDEKGLEFAQKFIAEKDFDKQIDSKIEDVSKPLPYGDDQFDYIYARLVLHYLAKDVLPGALAELKRVLKPGGKLFVVVRSTECTDAKRPDNTYDPVTGLTTYQITNPDGQTRTFQRHFHTRDSIGRAVAAAGFEVQRTDQYDETLFMDFMHSKPSPHTDNVIELLATKPTID